MKSAVALIFVFVLIACSDSRNTVQAMAVDPLPCQTDADCCVVFDGCRATGYIVSAKDFENAQAALKGASNTSCVKCINPMLNVACEAGSCKTTRLEGGAAGAEAFYQDHCGKLPVPAGFTEKVVSTTPSLQPLKAVGCI